MQVLSVSALTGENIDKVLPMIIQAAVDVKAVSGE
jgi:translation initiation factor IF-2